MKRRTLCIDLAKDCFQVSVSDGEGRVSEPHRLNRTQFVEFMAQSPISRVLVEACGTAHYWARTWSAMGHQVELLPAQYVRPYRRGNKTDRRDADALIEAGRCDDIERALEQIARNDEVVKRLRQVESIGQLNATAMVATAGSANHFHSGRRFAAWLGITPRESSSGYRHNLGKITKRGDVYLRTLLIHGARSVPARAKQLARSDPGRLSRLQEWGLQLGRRVGHNKAAVAFANKLARICWAVWRNDIPYQPGYGA
jgi:transposase